MDKTKAFLSRMIFLLAILLPIAFVDVTYADEIVIDNTGSNSSNQINVSTTSSTDVQNSNNANIQNNINLSANTGNNTASGNTGDGSINTGTIETTSQVSTSANANTFSSTCGCPSQDISAAISNTGYGSENQILANSNNKLTISNSNVANNTNNIAGSANTGENNASSNTANASITTGNITGSVGISNHDININDLSITGEDNSMSLASISNTGAFSDNNINLNFINAIEVDNNNRASINNFLDFLFDTGFNTASGNTGDAVIRSGDIVFNALVENGPINVNKVKIVCAERLVPTPPLPPTITPPSPPATIPGPGSSTNPGGSFSSSGEVLGAAIAAAGEIMPVTGSFLLYFLTIIAVMMFASGWYFRLHPGNNPNLGLAKA